MRFYTEQHAFSCGVDLHARSLYLCVLDAKRKVLLHKPIPAAPQPFLEAISPFRKDLVVAAECTFTWYWLADLCSENHIPFVLAHALYLKAIHGAKAKNDRIDSFTIASLLRGGLIPMAYVYPHDMRATRDLLRRRMHLMHKRSELLAHIQNTHSQYNLPAPTKKLAYKGNREGVSDSFDDPMVRKSIQTNLALIDTYDTLLADLELTVLREARTHDSLSLALLRSVPGIGKILSLVLLYEIGDINRFPSVQDFASYARLVKCQRSSAGKLSGTQGSKIGNVHLKWAFSEASVLFLRLNPNGKRLVARLEKKHGKGKALSILSHKIGRAVYFMLKRKRPFDMKKFMSS